MAAIRRLFFLDKPAQKAGDVEAFGGAVEFVAKADVVGIEGFVLLDTADLQAEPFEKTARTIGFSHIMKTTSLSRDVIKEIIFDTHYKRLPTGALCAGQ